MLRKLLQTPRIATICSANRPPCIGRHSHLLTTASSSNQQRRQCLVTLAIETSCDDTSVAVLEKHNVPVPDGDLNANFDKRVQVHFHAKLTADNLVYRGIHPSIAQASHEQNLARLIADAIQSLPRQQKPDSSLIATPRSHNDTPLPSDNTGDGGHIGTDEAQANAQFRPQSPTRPRIPDFVTVTRGPGMRASLNTGLNTAKGLAVAWNVPLVAVNHMQAHALTPRLVSALQQPSSPSSRSSSTSSSPALPTVLSSSTATTTTAKPPSLQAYAQSKNQHHTYPDHDHDPPFPFLTLLVSGGHTMLLHSKSLANHTTLAETTDIAVGDAIDKIARDILPASVLDTAANTMYGPVLEKFAFPDAFTRASAPPSNATPPTTTLPPDPSSENPSQPTSTYTYDSYAAPLTRGAEMQSRASKWGWNLTPPLAAPRDGPRANGLYSFTGITAAVRRAVDGIEGRRPGRRAEAGTGVMGRNDGAGEEEQRGKTEGKEEQEGNLKGEEEIEEAEVEERRVLAREAMRVAFEHVASRVILGLREMERERRCSGDDGAEDLDGGEGHIVETLVVSGGVAANGFLRHVLRKFLDVRGYSQIRLVFPPLELCTDNALMIGWAGIEMFEAGWTSDLSCQSLRRWSLDPEAEDGGILGPPGWKQMERKS